VKAAGFSVIEVLVATTIVMVGVGALAALSVVSTARNAAAHSTTMTLLLAEQKMEHLRGADVGPSPAGTLSSNTVGWVDYLDATGKPLGVVSDTPPAAAMYIRRWSVEPVAANAGETIVLQVLVTTHRNRGSADVPVDVRRLPDETRLVSAKTRTIGS
jgi:type II secretory pathway pseudopilin PulG